MSFLMSPRLAFAGRFLSDVSTINNLSGDDGWNAQGGAAFEFLNCRITGGWAPDPAAADDPATRLALAGRPDGSSAKMVDLDPDCQWASQLWGLWVRVFDLATGALAFMGRYEVASFRDLWTRQVVETMAGGPVNGQPSGARYVSTLKDIEWGPVAERSALLSRLRDVSGDELSISLHQFGFFYATDHPRYRTATLVGSIGPRQRDEPRTAIVGRRLQGIPLPNTQFNALGMVDVEVARDGTRIAMDLGHALPIDNVDGAITNLGQWTALPQLAGCEALALGLAASNFTPFGKAPASTAVFGEVDPFVPGWYAKSGGVVEFELTPAQSKSLAGAPLALYGRLGTGELVAITSEVLDGLFVRADSFVFRMEPGESAQAELYVRRYGEPVAGVDIVLTPQAPPVPPALKAPDKVISGKDGRIVIPLAASDPGSPRKGEGGTQPSPDGQVYALNYAPASGSAGAGLSFLDAVVVHVRAAYDVPAEPNWEDHVQPIMADYAAFYPIMSKHLFDIANYDAIVAHLPQLRLAFSREIENSNYMPVTRDLSAGKRRTIVKWLNTETGDPAAPLRRRAQPASAISASARPLSTFVDRAPGPRDKDVKRDIPSAFTPKFSSNAGGSDHDPD